jgi:nanoRNase/pAp phosphatase (c-di-AMP/oligoRNAs hydrolase)
VNVANLAKQFGGGGHARAAGARAAEPIDSLKGRVIDACEKAMK